MSKFKFIFSRGECELASYDSSGAGAEIIFPKGTSGEVKVGNQSFPLVSGRALLHLAGIKDGLYQPTLCYGEREYKLATVKKDGNRVLHPGYTTDELCAKFDEQRRIRSALRELSERYNKLEEYVLGKGIF